MAYFVCLPSSHLGLIFRTSSRRNEFIDPISPEYTFTLCSRQEKQYVQYILVDFVLEGLSFHSAFCFDWSTFIGLVALLSDTCTIIVKLPDLPELSDNLACAGVDSAKCLYDLPQCTFVAWYVGPGNGYRQLDIKTLEFFGVKSSTLLSSKISFDGNPLGPTFRTMDEAWDVSRGSIY